MSDRLKSPRPRAIALLVLIVVGACHRPPVPPTRPAGGCGPDPGERLVDAINRVRRERHLPALHGHRRLVTAANRHSTDMARNGVMTHTGSDGSTFQSRAADAGYRMRTGGEVVAAGYPMAATVVADWLRSPSHRSILLDVDAVQIGAACAPGTGGMPYWTAVVGAERGG